MKKMASQRDNHAKKSEGGISADPERTITLQHIWTKFLNFG